MRFRRRKVIVTLALLMPLGAVVCYVAAVVTPVVDEPAAFATPPGGEPWTFAFVGDTQLADDKLDPLFARLATHHPEFVLHLGDMVDEATSDLEWDRLIESAVKHRLRLMPVVGNHDVRGDYDDDGSIRFRQYFPDLPQTFYHFRHRGVNFLMVNSERSLAAGSEQAEFLKFHLEKHPGTTLVCLHRPVFTAGNRDRLSMLGRRFWLHGALAGGDTVAVLAGHNHYYDRTKPLDGVTYVTSGGGGGPSREKPEPAGYTAALESGAMHYGLARVYDDRIVVEVRTLDDDRRLDEFALALRPTERKLGGYHNRRSMELPPIAELPQYRREALTAGRDRPQMPRPW
jgi:predicted phosphodiesterase